MAEDVTKRTASASAALLGARVFVKVVDLALILILAAILVPEDFALVALAMVFIQFTESITEIPVIQAIIRAPKITDRMLYTSFTISFIHSLIITGFVALLAPVAMYIYDDQRLGLLMIFLSLSPALRGLVNPKLVLYARRLNYFPEAIIDVLAKFVTAGIAIPLALWTESYWSLAIMTVLTPVGMIIGSYLYAPYRPRLTLKDWSIFADMVGWSFVSQIFIAANWQADIAVLGGYDKQKQILGQYSISQTLAGAPYQVFVIPVIKPFIAAFAELRKPELIRPGYLTASTSVVVFVAPILALVAALSEPIVALAFKPEWASASLLLAALSIMGILSLPAQPVASVVLALDKTRYNALQAAIGLCVKIPALFIGWNVAGLNGFLVGLVFGAAAWSIAGAFIVRHLIGLSLRDQALALMRPLLGIVALAIVARLLQPFLIFDSTLMLILTSGVLAAAGMIAYVAVVGFLWKMAGEPDGIERMAAGLIRKILKLPQPEYPQTPETNDIPES